MVGRKEPRLTQAAPCPTPGDMADADPPDRNKQAKEARLAQALRSNLRRRKAAGRITPPPVKPADAAD